MQAAGRRGKAVSDGSDSLPGVSTTREPAGVLEHTPENPRDFELQGTLVDNA